MLIGVLAEEVPMDEQRGVTRWYRARRRAVVVAFVVAIGSVVVPVASATAKSRVAAPVERPAPVAAPTTEPAFARRPRRLTALAAPTPAPVLRAGDRVVLWGDSLAFEAREAFGAAIAQATGGRVVVETRTYGGTATCDWLPEIAAMSQQPIAVAVLEFSGNALTPCMTDGTGRALEGDAYLDAYAHATQQAITLLRNAGARVVLAGAPRARTEPSPTSVALQEMYRTLAARSAGVSFVDAGAAVLDSAGRWTATLPCLPDEGPGEGCAGGRIAVRAPDGAHFCPGAPAAVHGVTGTCPRWSSGAVRFGRAMAAAVASRAV
jgi:hypothetical protein